MSIVQADNSATTPSTTPSTTRSTTRSMMASDQAGFFSDNGYLVADSAFAPDEIAELRHDAAQICRGSYRSFRGLVPTEADETDDQVLRRYLCIHFPHKMSPLMARTISHPAIVSVLERIIGPDVKCMQSMLFIKASGKPGQAWHQDEFYIPTRDRSLCGAWIAIDDATIENGCLWVIPGSHKSGILWPQHEHDDQRFDCTGEATRFPYTEADSIPVEVKAGSIVFFNGYLLHRSMPNGAATGYRRALVNHYMSASSLLPWTSTAAKQSVATADYRDIVLVAGVDPYAYKGVENLAEPHVRPSGEGGCGNQQHNKAGTEATAERR